MSEIAIPPEVMAKLNAARRTKHHNARAWLDWEDEVVRQYWHDGAMRRIDLANIIGVSTTTLVKRAKELGL